MDQDFKVKVGEFEGPLAVLLELIEKRKMHISTVSLAAVTDDYLTYLNDHPGLPPGELANFILIAATLMLIKSLTLLPTLEVTPEEKASIEDLERRLKLYAEIRKVTEDIKKRWGTTPLYQPAKDRPIIPVFTVPPDLTLDNLVKALSETLKTLPQVERVAEAVVKKIISLEEVITNLAERVQTSISLKWSQIKSESGGEKKTLIVHFLGLLELVKQGILAVEQKSHFADIDFSRENNKKAGSSLPG